jgi:beta-phosphoglucomutase-like phosphatase (HAD superfamily)
VGEAIAAGVPVAVCSTSNEKAVSTIVRVLLGDDVAAKMPVYAGDIVPSKKPSPDIYLLAAKEMGLEPADCVVVEDSGIGVAAAKAAGMRCVAMDGATRERSSTTQLRASGGLSSLYTFLN